MYPATKIHEVQARIASVNEELLATLHAQTRANLESMQDKNALALREAKEMYIIKNHIVVDEPIDMFTNDEIDAAISAWDKSYALGAH